MKVTLYSTSKIVDVEINGQSLPARIWEGHTASGIPIIAMITRVAVSKDIEDHSQFERELQEVDPPSAEVYAWPDRLVF